MALRGRKRDKVAGALEGVRSEHKEVTPKGDVFLVQRVYVLPSTKCSATIGVPTLRSHIDATSAN